MGQFPIFIINRDQDTRRMACIAQQCAEQGLEFERMPAVDGLNVPDVFRSQFLDDLGRPRSNLLAGEIGCYASHLMCCREIVRRDVPYAVVLEDDVALDGRFAEIVRSAVENVPSEWDIVRLANKTDAPVVNVARLIGDHQLVRYFKIPKGMLGQIWSQRGAQKMLGGSSSEGWTWRRRPVDVDLHYRGTIYMKTFGVLPRPVYEGPVVGSTIANQKRNKARGAVVTRLDPWSRWQGVMRCIDELGTTNATSCLLKFWGYLPRKKVRRIGSVLRNAIQS